MCRKTLSSLLLVIILGCGLASCVASDVATDVAPQPITKPHKIAIASRKQQVLPPPSLNGNLWERMRHDFAMPNDTERPEVQQRIRWFAKNQDYLNRTIARSAPYIYYIYQQTQIRHLPAELALIPIVESDYNPTAYNVSGASGLWQMMPDTAAGFGLKKDWWYDGRHDVVASTNAALSFFNYLHSFFDNDWLLAVAAYDWGPGAVQHVERANRSHDEESDFWHLPMPAETRDYVPRLLALAAIVRDPERYGIQLLPINDAPYIEQVNVGTQIDIAQAAKLAGVSEATIHHLNPGYRRWATDPNGPYTLLIPVSNAEKFKTNLAALPTAERTGFRYHIVAAGETLERIAAHYKTSTSILRRINNLRSSYVHTHEGIVLPKKPEATPTILADATVATTPTISSPVAVEDPADSAPPSTPTIADDSTSDVAPTLTTIRYKVKRGDTLQKVASKYNLSTSELAAWNHFSLHHILKPNTHLVIRRPAADQEKIAQTSKSQSSKNVLRENQLLAQELSLKTSASSSQPLRYTVRSGDELYRIAKRFNVSVNDLKRWNHLSQNAVHPGKKLVIYKTA
jgi:membrane-bound lytic murein transglycosylase D